MSRLTGSDALGLFEAYQAVYAPQELTEEQVWEEVEYWVNDLMREGYDLSEYTWEEMYESYLKEFFGPNMEKARYGSPERATRERLDMGVVKGGGRSGYTVSTTDKPKSGESTSQWQTRRTQALALANKLNKETGLGKNKKTTSLSNIPTGTKNSPYTEKNLGADQYKAYKDGGGDAAFSKGSGTAAEIIARGRKAASATTTATTTPARISGGTPARSSGASPAKSSGGTSPTVPKSGPASTPTSTMPTAERRTPTSAELRAAQGARKSALEAGKTKPEAEKSAVQAGIDRGTKLMGGPEGPGKIDTSSVQRDLARANAPKPTPTATPTPSATKPSPSPANKARGSSKPGSIVSSFDLFDVVMGHLLDEGYADTQESALAIMANMSEEWRESIVEGSAAMSANVPSGRTVKMSASGKEPAGDALVRRAGEAISGVLGNRGRVQSTTTQPRKPLVSTSKPGPSNNFGRGF